MRLSTALAALLVGVVEAHYTFPKIGSTSDWQYVRKTQNWQSNGPTTSVTNDAIRCYQLAPGGAGTQTMSVAAGSALTWGSAPNIFHPGPLSAYMAKVPANESIESWDGVGRVWFKVFQEKPTIGSGGMTWSSEGKSSVSFNIPKCIAPGDYLFRIEHVALHMASNAGGAQFYISCAQIKVTGGGNGSPQAADLVAFPGAYKPTDPGIMVNIWAAKQFTPAGPAVFAC